MSIHPAVVVLIILTFCNTTLKFHQAQVEYSMLPLFFTFIQNKAVCKSANANTFQNI